MDQIVNVITPSPTYDLLTLDEAKLMLNIPLATVSSDDQLKLMITLVSDSIAVGCARVFGYEEVEEKFVDIEDDCNRTKRLYLSRWPVKTLDLISLTDDADGSDLLLDVDFRLEESTGILYRLAGWWTGNITAVYSGGYVLPDDAPPSLKQASSLLTREAYNASIRGDSSVRSLSHKDSRIMFFSAQQMAGGGGASGTSSGGGPAHSAATALLARYRRAWV